jgi:uncharacterized protein (DUF983 family)
MAPPLFARRAELRRPPVSEALRRALRLRCPACGEGRPFRRWLAVERRCERCGLPIYRESGYFVGAIYVTYLLAVAPVLVAFLCLPRRFPQAVYLEASIYVLAAALLVLVAMPLGRSLWLGFDFFLDPWSADDPDISSSNAGR